MNVGQGGRQSLDITMETAVENCLILLDLASVSVRVPVCWKYEPGANNRGAPFLSTFKFDDLSCRRYQHKRSLGKVLLAYDKEKL